MGQSATYALNDCEKGKTFLIQSISGDRPMRAKIHSLGFTLGAKVHICDNCTCGCSRVVIRNSSLVIGEDIAKVIFCAPCEFDSAADATCTL